MERTKPFAWAAGLLLALALLLGVAAPALAVNSTDERTVTIAGVEAGVTAETYQIFTVNWNDGIEAPNDPIYQWNDSMVKWLNGNGYGQYVDGANGVAEQYKDADAAFFDKLAAAVKGGSVTVDQVDSVTTGDNGLVLTEKMGGYLTIINNSADRVYQPIAFNVYPEYKDGAWTLTSNHKDATENVKWRQIDIDKTVKDVKIIGAQYGDVLPFAITVDVPNYPANAIQASKKFTVSDQFPAGLTYNGDVKVYGMQGDKKIELSSDLYTVGTKDLKGNDRTFAVSFKYDGIAQYTKVVLEYTGTLNQNAVIGSTGNENEAILEWNNKPYDENGYKTDDSKVKVFSYGIEVLKHAKGSEATVLSGAVFNVSLDGKDIFFTKAANGHYKVAATDAPGASKDVTTDANGKLFVEGLNEGSYLLTETVPPAGYNKPAQPFTFEIKDVKADGQLTGTVENQVTDGYTYGKIANSTGFQLPVTGGAGTIAITALGVVAIAAALTLLLRGRKAQH